LLVGADEMEPYKKICKVLGKEEGIPEFPVEMAYFPAIRKRTKLASKIDKDSHVNLKKESTAEWFRKHAAEMDIELDDDIIRETSTPKDDASAQRIHDLKQELKRLLDQPILPMGNSSVYLTSGLVQQLPEKFRESEKLGKKVVPNDTKKTAIEASKQKRKRN